MRLGLNESHENSYLTRVILKKISILLKPHERDWDPTLQKTHFFCFLTFTLSKVSAYLCRQLPKLKKGTFRGDRFLGLCCRGQICEPVAGDRKSLSRKPNLKFGLFLAVGCRCFVKDCTYVGILSNFWKSNFWVLLTPIFSPTTPPFLELKLDFEKVGERW